MENKIKKADEKSKKMWFELFSLLEIYILMWTECEPRWELCSVVVCTCILHCIWIKMVNALIL